MVRGLFLLLSLILLFGCRKAESGDPLSILALATEALDNGDFASAMSLASDALDNLSTDGMERSRADALLIIAKTHSEAGNHLAALTYAREASATAPNYVSAHRKLVDYAVEAGNYDLALVELDKIVPVDSVAIIQSLRQCIVPSLASGKSSRAITALKTLFSDSVWLPVDQRVILAEYYLERNRKDSAGYVMDGVDEELLLTPADLEALARYYSDRGESGKALQLWYRLSQVQDSILKAVSASSIYGNLYNMEHLRRLDEEETARSAHRRMLLIIAICMVTMVIFTIVLLYVRSIHKKRLLEAENRLFMAYEELREMSERSRTTISRLFKESYDSVEMAANMLIDSTASANVAANLRVRLEKRIDACRTPKFRADLEHEINVCHNNAFARLRDAVPSLSDSEINVALYCAAGLSSRVLCLLLDCTTSALYNKKYRLKGKIRNCNVPDEDIELFLSLIG